MQKELDEALGNSEDPVATYEQVKNLPYLEAVINEGMRIHSTVGIGLPRVVPEGGVTVCGKTFPEGTVLGVPMYTIHRDADVWGADADIFRPERWFERDLAKLQKSFHPFSFGPRYGRRTYSPCHAHDLEVGHVLAETWLRRSWLSSCPRLFAVMILCSNNPGSR